MTVQLPLAIGLRDDAAFANFYPGKNAEAVKCIKESVTGRHSEGSIFVWGGAGTGKSHLLQAVCRIATEAGFSAAYLPLAAADEFAPDILEGLEALSLVCIDDIHHVAGRPDWETALFHLYNRMFESGAQLIVAANANIPQLGIGLPDLSSRLAWGFAFHLHALDEEEKLAALRLRACQRGMQLPPEVGSYLIRRCPRDMVSLFELLERLDAATLAAQRKLTVPFVREWMSGGGGRQEALF